MATSSAYEKKRRRLNVRFFLNLYKTHSACSDCKRYYPAPVMEFDHVGVAKKIDSVARMVLNGLSLKTILAEIKKCELVCANCHRIRTTNRKKK